MLWVSDVIRHSEVLIMHIQIKPTQSGIRYYDLYLDGVLIQGGRHATKRGAEGAKAAYEKLIADKGAMIVAKANLLK